MTPYGWVLKAGMVRVWVGVKLIPLLHKGPLVTQGPYQSASEIGQYKAPYKFTFFLVTQVLYNDYYQLQRVRILARYYRFTLHRCLNNLTESLCIEMTCKSMVYCITVVT